MVRHWRGTQPSNTLSCLNSLTEDAVARGEFSGLEVRVEAVDEIVTRVDPRKIARKFRRDGTKVVVGLVGVQTNQYPRSQDLARQFKAAGCDVLIGGFHVSGAVAMSPGRAMPPECQEMLDAGVTLVAGEVEDRWGDLLRDAAGDRLLPFYDFLDDKPDLYDRPVPRADPKTQKKFVLTATGTIDAGRGCPFNCSFCTIINVQGRKMRARSAEQILNCIRGNYYVPGTKKTNVVHYFFTDDNFARNPHWEAIFDGLIKLREEEDMSINFMMQVDVLAPKLPNFVEKAARAGCVQVFIGMEAIRDDNLEAAGKKQNRISDYGQMIAHWHSVGVICHVGYIIGFPNDTYERVMDDIRVLREDILVDQASFFMLTPLPGSRDHLKAAQSGLPMVEDYNSFDSFHATYPHERMSAEVWQATFHDAWSEFYSFDQMKKILLRQNPHTYWAALKNFIWYRAGMIERAHPMITGFVRRKDRKSRRPGFPIERRWAFFKRRVRENAYILREYAKLYFEMQELWLLTRIRREEYAFLGDLRKLASQSMHEVKVNWGRVHEVMGERVDGARESVGTRYSLLSTTMSARLDAVREAIGVRASALGTSVGDRMGVVRETVGASVHSAGKSLSDHAQALQTAVRGSLETSLQAAGKSLNARAQVVQTAMADLRIKYLPPVKRPSWPGRLVRRLNVFSMRRIQTRQHLTDYWQRTWHSTRHLRFWKLNPITLTWNLARDTKYTVAFFFAMMAEKY